MLNIRYGTMTQALRPSLTFASCDVLMNGRDIELFCIETPRLDPGEIAFRPLTRKITPCKQAN